MAGPFYEGGHKGPLESLGGLVQDDGRGRIVVDGSQVVAAGSYIQIFGANGKRIAAIFQNLGPDDLSIVPGIGANPFAVLPKYGVLQIDKDLPWTGDLYASTAGSSTLYAQEISLP